MTDSLYYPYPNSIYLHHNIYERDKQFPSLSFQQPIGFLLAYNFWRNIPDIIYDGILDKNKLGTNQKLLDEYKICIKDNINASFANIDAGNDFKNVSRNILDYECSHDNLLGVKYPFDN